MTSQTILTLVLVIGSFIVKISEAGDLDSTVTSKNSADEYVLGLRTKRSAANGPRCVPYGVDERLFQNGGYCRHIIGNLPVFGSDIDELYNNEKNMRRYQMTTYLFQKMQNNFLHQIRLNLTEQQKRIWEKSFEVRQSCLEQVDDIYCHHYFKRCYLSSSPQLLCREACEELVFKQCDREFKMVSDFNREQLKFPDWPFDWDIINCTTLPFRNQSSNCYFPDKIREKLNLLESEDCFYGDGRGYHGNASTTVSGFTCQSWNARWPHKHNINGEIYEEIRNSSNFCRNPGGLALNGTWCFTTNRTVRWEYCDVPKCANRAPSSPPAEFRGHNLSSTSIQIFWGDVPKPFVNGILLGFHVACKILNSSDRHFADLAPTEHVWEFKGLEKFVKYSCFVRACNNFGNGTWSDELVISTDEDVPSAPPESLQAWNLSSTTLHVRWEPLPVRERNGRILGYKVELMLPEKQKQGRRKPTANYTTSRSLTFSGLQKYSKYVVRVCALTRRGAGPTRVLTAQTDEDVPDRPPTDITAFSLGTNAVNVEWGPVPPEYTNGEVLGYKVLYSDANDTSLSNSAVTSPEECRLTISGLRSNTNYSFQILAFTAKGDGANSAKYFARTRPDAFERSSTTYVYNSDKPPISATGTISAVVLSCIVALCAVFLAIYFVRKRRKSTNSNNGNTRAAIVEAYATSSLDWIERIIATHGHGYETLDDDNVPTTTRQPLYINIAPDGSLNLPPHLRDIVVEFEQSYENTSYRRLHRRRGSHGGAEDDLGRPIYDKLERVLSSCKPPCKTLRCGQEGHEMTTAESSKEHKQHQSLDLGELRGFVQAFQGDVGSREMMEMGAMGQTRRRQRRRFSVDLGEVREFIALREMRIPSKNESTALADQPEVQEARHHEASC